MRFLLIPACSYNEPQEDAALPVCFMPLHYCPSFNYSVTEQGDRMTHCFQDSFSTNSIICSLTSVSCWTFSCAFAWTIMRRLLLAFKIRWCIWVFICNSDCVNTTEEHPTQAEDGRTVWGREAMTSCWDNYYSVTMAQEKEKVCLCVVIILHTWATQLKTPQVTSIPG